MTSSVKDLVAPAGQAVADHRALALLPGACAFRPADDRSAAPGLIRHMRVAGRARHYLAEGVAHHRAARGASAGARALFGDLLALREVGLEARHVGILRVDHRLPGTARHKYASQKDAQPLH